MPKDNPVTPEEYADRVNYILDLIAKGLSQKQCVNYCLERADWNVTRRQVYYYYDAAWKQLADEATRIDRRSYLMRHLARLDHIFMKAMEIRDYRQATAAEIQVFRALKLDEPGANMDWEQAAKEAFGVDSASQVFEKLIQSAQGILNVEPDADNASDH